MLVNNSLAGVIIDRFKEECDDDSGRRGSFPGECGRACEQAVFLGWVFSLGKAVKIIGPDEVVEQMRGEARRLMEQYGE